MLRRYGHALRTWAAIALALGTLLGGLGLAVHVPPTATVDGSIGGALPPAPTTYAASPAGATPAPSSPHAAFEQRVLATARALAAAGIPADRYSLPNLDPPIRTSDGLIEPAPSSIGHDAYPEGVAYYGVSDPNGTVLTTTVNASSVAGQITVNSLNTTYLDTDNPDVSGVQLNCILANVTIQGVPGNEFWTQNALDYIQENQTLAFGEDTWNFTNGGAYVPSGNSTIAAHSPNGSVEAGIYIGFGPYLPAPTPFTLTVYLNSSVTAANDQELWYNYSLAAAGEPYRSGNYDWLVFNSTGAGPAPALPIAPFEASGNGSNPIGVPYDYEMDFGIAPYNGATMDTFSANVSATLRYCPASIPACSPGQLTSVPSAEDFGSQTGETGEGLSFTYSGTTAYATGGPGIGQGLWGFQAVPGTAPGATPVANEISTTGGPVASATAPYVFVFLNNTATGDGYVWAPDVPVWHLMPGNYSYLLMLSDYASETGSLTVGTARTALNATLHYSAASGVYTPLWALNNGQLAGLSTSGSGTLASPYQLFNNPTDDCTDCAGAPNGNLTGWFFDFNDYLYPTFPGVLLQGTSAYVDLAHAPTFTVWNESVGSGATYQNWNFDLPIEFYHTAHATLSDASGIGTWPTMFEILMVDYAPAAQNPFPQANVVVWDSTSDLIMADHFTTEPVPGLVCGPGGCPALSCGFGCVSPDELMLYGGSNNTVWGNVFSDPPGTTLATGGGALYAGLAEGESGDLIFNNNFSVDNPTMLMAYDVYNDSCWASYAGLCLPLFTPSYADTWNVTNQSALAVARVVNGYALSGNVLGAQYRYQGGNYWWNWGGSENPYSVLPYSNVFDYTQNTTNLPSGYAAVESSIRVGGDYVPLRLGFTGASASLTFQETGLPSGTSWTVTLDGSIVNSSTTSVLTFADLVAGTYTYSFGAVAGFTVPSPGQISLTTTATINVTFSRPAVDYVVSFEESGLPAGYTWTVVFNGTGGSATGGWINVTEPNGSYAFSAAAPTWYQATPASGPVVVAGGNQTVRIAFTHVLDRVLFAESGLPAGTNWSIRLGTDLNWSSAGAIGFLLANGTYPLSIPSVAGYTAGFLVASYTDGVVVRSAANGSLPSDLVVGGLYLNATLEFQKANSTSSPAGPLGLAPLGWVAIGVGVLALAVIVGLLARRKPAPPAPLESPPPAP
jgi:thermopsin